MSNMSRSGAYRKALEVYYTLPQLGISYDTTITNAAISACEKGTLLLNYYVHILDDVNKTNKTFAAQWR